MYCCNCGAKLSDCAPSCGACGTSTAPNKTAPERQGVSLMKTFLALGMVGLIVGVIGMVRLQGQAIKRDMEQAARELEGARQMGAKTAHIGELATTQRWEIVITKVGGIKKEGNVVFVGVQWGYKNISRAPIGIMARPELRLQIGRAHV